VRGEGLNRDKGNGIIASDLMRMEKEKRQDADTAAN
jgi:hypothetical protein